ncbi:helix-turn-helix domain-containing protein [Streptomyces sp. NBC_00885]|uniref:helix-turn-helix domain-containing protein n=1 Tax=Streptomyces sp. NBC_00885 TaxID=2975857 RepID=UPI00386AE555|nr:helix-turn-helix domain-containing protein [Streptomyces sp. NBC_00885]
MTDGTHQRGAERRPDPPEDVDGAADLNRAVGKQLKLLRERAGWTQKELGDRLGYSEDLISSLERGRRTPQPELLDAADDLLGAGGLLKATKDDVARAKARARVRHPAWFRDYARLEAEAVEVNFYSTLTVPGLTCVVADRGLVARSSWCRVARFRGWRPWCRGWRRPSDSFRLHIADR